MIAFVVILLLGLHSIEFASAEKVVVCYYGTWAVYREGNGQVSVDDLDPNLCTHMIYTFVGVSPNGDVALLDPNVDINKQGLSKFVGLKAKNPNLKVLVAIGGWGQGAGGFSAVVNNPSLRAVFVKNIVKFVDTHGFDGFDLDWEFPGDESTGGKPADKQSFIEWIKELRTALGSKLLTAAVGATKVHRDRSYDIPNLSKYLDFINVMSYDVHAYWDQKTGHNAPLYAGTGDSDPNMNIEGIVKDWIAAGASPSKLVLGLGLYGRSYTLSTSQMNVGAPISGAGIPGPFTQEGGSLSYLEICLKIKNEGWSYSYDDERQVPQAFKGNQWVGYDDTRSIGMKVDLANKYNLKGVMVWSLEQDDVHNACGQGNFPLLQAINQKIGGGGSAPQPQVIPPSNPVPNNPPATAVPKATTAAPNSSNICSTVGYVRDPSNCSVFYYCGADGNKTPFTCPGGLKYNSNTGACDWTAPGC